MEKKLTREDMMICLKDSGCEAQLIDEFLACLEDGQRQSILLKRQKCILLEKLHENQRQIDCLDYLLYKLKKEGEK